MATLEAVVTELQELNQHSDLNLEATFEVGDRISTLDATMGHLSDVMMQFLDTVPASILQGFDALIAFEEKQNKIRSREEEVDQQQDQPKPEGFFKGNFMEGFNSKPLEKASSGIITFIAEIVQTVGAIAGVVAAIGGIGAIIPALTAAAAAAAPVIAIAAAAIFGVIAVVNGLIEAFSWFNSQEGTLGDKILAALQGFVTGILKVITWPLDFIKNLISGGLKAIFGENEVSKFLDSFTIFDTLAGIFDVMFNVIEDLIEFISPVTNFIGGVFVDAFKGLFGAIKAVADAIGTVVDFMFGAINKVLGFFGMGIDTPASEEDAAVQLSNEEQDEAISSARKSKLYNKNILGESEVDESKLKDASVNQLQAILNDDDISEKQKEVVQKELETRVANQEKRGKVIGDEPPASTTVDPETGKRGMVIGDGPVSRTETETTVKEVGGVVVEQEGVPRKEYTESEIEKINTARAAATAMGNEDPLPDFNPQVSVPAETRYVEIGGTKFTEEEAAMMGVSVPDKSTTVSRDTFPASRAPAVNIEERERPVPTKVDRVTRKRGRVIGDAPPVPTKVDPETGKRGMVIPDGVVTSTTNVDVTAGSADLDYSVQLEQIKEDLYSLFDPVVSAVTTVKDFFMNLIPIGKIQEALTNLFAEIGIPRVEFTIPFIDKTVGFGPFYPFRPGEGTTQIASQTSVETSSSLQGGAGLSDYKKTFKDNASGIEDDSVFSYAKQQETQQVVNELGQKEYINTSTGVSASFDDMTGKGRVVFDENKTIDNLTTNSFEETSSVLKEYEVGPIAMGKVRRMIDAGASPDQVREFLELNERSISEKISSFFSNQVDNASSFVSSFFSDEPMESDQLVPAQERTEMTQELGQQQTKLDNAKAEETSSSIIAPQVQANNNSTTINNKTINSGVFPSAVDRSDRTDRRGAFRGRAI